jgi:hypothetical protein
VGLLSAHLGDITFDSLNIKWIDCAPLGILLQGGQTLKRLRSLWLTQDFRWYLCHFVSNSSLIVWWRAQ